MVQVKVGEIRRQRNRIKGILRRILRTNNSDDEMVLRGLIYKYGQEYIADLLKEVVDEDMDGLWAED